MTNFNIYTDLQLDAIYYATVGYEPIADGEMTRAQVIELLTEYERDCETVIIPEF